MVKTFNNSPIKEIDRRGLRKLASHVWRAFSTEKCEISLNFVSVSEITDLNKNYLDKANPTDVIAFNLGNGPETRLIADIYICPEVARKNAEIYDCDLATELARLVIHGILHVIGHDDTTDKQRNEMHRLENKFLRKYTTIKYDQERAT
ncbi:MAG: rRNA maturation RNase YbeY [bacterium]